MENIRERVTLLLKCMEQGAYEREEVIGLALLSALSGESIFMLGLPGVGKSMVARRLKMAFKDSTCFEYLMSRFSTPDEIFGPVSISKLKDNDTYERCIDGYLPTADIVFLDEIWKAGPAIQNALLTVLNEKIFRNGNTDVRLPLKGVISASNELPAEGEGLEALWDRFLVRYIVDPIQSKSRFLDLVLGKTEECDVPEQIKITHSELAEVLNLSKEVEVPEYITDIIYNIREALVEAKRKEESNEMDANDEDAPEAPYVSDRRWRKIVGLLRTSALLNGRDTVDLSDCILMEHMIWDKDQQLHSVRELIATAIVKSLKEVHLIDMHHRMTRSEKFTNPVGDFISPDGLHFVFRASNEDILIRKEDYNCLSESPRSACLTDDNRLVFDTGTCTFQVRRIKPGTITLNSFSYPLKRPNALRTGDINDMIDSISNETSSIFAVLQALAENNIFLRPFSEYEELTETLNKERNRISKLRR